MQQPRRNRCSNSTKCSNKRSQLSKQLPNKYDSTNPHNNSNLPPTIGKHKHGRECSSRAQLCAPLRSNNAPTEGTTAARHLSAAIKTSTTVGRTDTTSKTTTPRPPDHARPWPPTCSDQDKYHGGRRRPSCHPRVDVHATRKDRNRQHNPT